MYGAVWEPQALIEPAPLLPAGPRRHRIQVAGQDEVEERAQVGERILHRRAGEQKAPLGAQAAQGPGVLGAPVLEVLGLVGDRAGELEALKERLVPHEGAVAGDDQVQRPERRGARQPPVAMVDEDAQVRGEARGLAPPVLQQGGRADDQGRHRSGPADGGEEAQGLQGLPEAHLVGEDPAQPVAVQMPEPGDPEALVRPQPAVQLRRQGRRRQARELAQGRAAGPPGGRRLEAWRQLGQELLGRRHLRGAHPPALPRRHGPLRVSGQRALGLAQPAELFAVEQDDLAGGLDVASARQQGAPQLGLRGRSGPQPEGDFEAVAGRGGGAENLRRPHARGVPLEIGSESRRKFAAQAPAFGGQKRQGLVPVAQPPLAVRGLGQEAVALQELEHGRIARVLPGGQGDRQEMLAAVDCHRLGRRPRPRRRGGSGLVRRRRRRGRQQLGDSDQPPPLPGDRALGRLRPGEERLARQGRGQFAQLRPAQLQEHPRRGSGRPQPALEQRQGGQERGPGSGGQVEIDPDGHGVADGRGGEIGREEDPQHRPT